MSQYLPTYSDILWHASNRIPSHRDEKIEVTEQIEIVNYKVHEKIIFSYVPSYWAFIEAWDIETEIVSHVPLYSDMVREYPEPKLIEATVPLYSQLVQVDEDYAQVVDSDEGKLDKLFQGEGRVSGAGGESSVASVKTKRLANRKIGLGLAVVGTVASLASLPVTALPSRNVEYYMFVLPALAIILGIVGERMNKQSLSKFYVNNVMFGVFCLILPVILLAVGWLDL